MSGKASKKRSRSKSPERSRGGDSAAGNSDSKLPPSAGYLITCDIPTKQFIKYHNELKAVDKRFILADLDETHLLVKAKAREWILSKVEEWNDSNVFSAVERVGEDLATV